MAKPTKNFLTTKNLVKILDALVVRPRWASAMATIGASEQTAFTYGTKSAKAEHDGDYSSIFYLEWPVGSGTMGFWHQHVSRARTFNVGVHETTIREQSLNGIPQIVRDLSQKIIYQERSEYIGRSDDFVMLSEGCEPEDVTRARLLLDSKGNPIPQVRMEQVPAAVRLRVLEQDARYIAKTQTDVHHSGEVLVAKPPERLPSDGVRPDIAKLRELAAMTPEQRRLRLEASPVALDKDGRRTIVSGEPSKRDDDLPRIEKPDTPIRASYARPVR